MGVRYRLTQAGGHWLTQPGGRRLLQATSPDIGSEVTAGLYRLPDLATRIASLDATSKRAWTDVLSEAGGASIAFQNDDPDLAAIVGDGNDLVAFSYRQTRTFTMVLETPAAVLADPEVSNEVTVWSGRGHGALLERYVIHPTLGFDSRPIEDDRTFGWPSPQYVITAAWVGPALVSDIPNAKANWGFAGSALWDANYPDDDAIVVWGAPGDINDAPVGEVYYRGTFAVVAAGTYELDVGIDNFGEVYVDGQLVASPGQDDGSTNGFAQTTRVKIDLSVGGHVIAIHAVNAQGGAGNNPGGFAWSLFTLDGSGQRIAMVTNTRHALTQLVLSYPLSAPGMTPGLILRTIVDEAQAEGALPWLALGFDDIHDSAGSPWPLISTFSTKVGTDFLTVLRQMAGSIIDWEMSPGAFQLRAWRYATRGQAVGVTIHPPTDTADATTGNLLKLTRSGAATPQNQILARWPGGWTSLDAPSSVGAHGRNQAFLALGAVSDMTEVIRILTAQLGVFALPRDAYTVATMPIDDTDAAYLAYHVGDTITVQHPNIPGGEIAERVVSITVSEDVDTGRAILTPSLKDLLLSAEDQFAQAIKALANGSLRGQAKVAQPIIGVFLPRGT